MPSRRQINAPANKFVTPNRKMENFTMNCKLLVVCADLSLTACASNPNSHVRDDDRSPSSSSSAAFAAGQIVTITGAASDAVDAIVLLDGPGRGGVVGRVGNGRLMTVDNCEGSWCHVRTTTGQRASGWIEMRHLRSR